MTVTALTPGASLAPTAGELQRLEAVACRREPADTVIVGGRLVNVITEEALDGWGLAIASGRIAYVGPDAARFAEGVTEVIDAEGRLVAPGLIDGHTHLLRTWLTEFVTWQVKVGVTSLVIDLTEAALGVGGLSLRDVMAASRSVDGRVFATFGLDAGPDPQRSDRIDVGDLAEGFENPAVVSIGELPWRQMLGDDPNQVSLIAAALERSLGVELHGYGASDHALNALAAMGGSCDHESLTREDVVERIRLGLYALVSVGPLRSELDALLPLLDGADAGLDLTRVGVTTDGVDPQALFDGRALNVTVMELIDAGMPLARAFRMASRTPAERHGLGRWIGALCPGMLADVLVLDGHAGLRAPDLVLVGGRRLGAPPTCAEGGAASPLPLSRFDLGQLVGPGPGRWRAVKAASPMLTSETVAEVGDAALAVAIDRADPRRSFRGLLVDYGVGSGAIAYTTGWASDCVMVVGHAPEDMRCALSGVKELGGGVVVARDAHVVAQCKATKGGLFADQPLPELVDALDGVRRSLFELGSTFADPLLPFEALTSGAIPSIRISPAGYHRVESGECVGLEPTTRH